MMLLAVSWMLAQVSAKPDPSGLPGSSVAERPVNGLFFYTLLGCLAGLLISVLIWVFSSRAQNYHRSSETKAETKSCTIVPRNSENPAICGAFFSAPERIRTSDLRFRSPSSA
jgi:hypothetical protein